MAAPDKTGPSTSKPRGRPRSTAAASHDQILDAVEAILREKSVYDLTIEEVARRAGVGKPTIYKWWPNKAALVLDMFQERVATQITMEVADTAEATIRAQVRDLIRLLNGFFGKVASDIIAEAQCDPDLLREYRERYLLKRRAFTAEVVERAKTTGEFRKDVDPELLIDLIYGPIYYRLLVQHQPLNQRFGKAVVDHALAAVRAGGAA